MTTGDLELATYLHGELLPLTEPLHEAFVRAEEDAARHLPPYSNAGHMSWLKSGHMRLGVREHLSLNMPAEWHLIGNPNMTGQLGLTNQAEDIVLRVLKDGRPPKNQIPNAGHNRVRRAYWRNTPMLEYAQEPMFGPVAHNLLLLWAAGDDEPYDLRVVRPVSEGKYGGQVATDFCLELAPTRTAFEELRFIGEDHEEDLFMTVHGDERMTSGEGTSG